MPELSGRPSSFAADSVLEGDGLERLVPPWRLRSGAHMVSAHGLHSSERHWSRNGRKVLIRLPPPVPVATRRRDGPGIDCGVTCCRRHSARELHQASPMTRKVRPPREVICDVAKSRRILDRVCIVAGARRSDRRRAKIGRGFDHVAFRQPGLDVDARGGDRRSQPADDGRL